MKDTEYAYAVAYMKTLENKMLTKSDFEALISALGLSAAMKLLADKGYGGNIDGGLTPEKLIDGETKKIWNEAQNCLPKEAPLEILKYRNDFHNLKTILKAFVTNSDWRSLTLSPSVVNPEDIYEAVRSADFSALPEFLRGTAKGAYEIVTQEHDGQQTEIYIDKMTYIKMAERADKNEFLSEWINKCILFADLSIAARAAGKSREFLKNALIPCRGIDPDRLVAAADGGMDSICAFITLLGFADGAKALEESFGGFEKWCDNKKMEFLKTAKNTFFGFEPIMAFLLGKEAEAQAVRIILSGHKNDIAPDIIRERLRDLYV